MVKQFCDICGKQTKRNFVKDGLKLVLGQRVDKPKPQKKNDATSVAASTEKYNQPDVWEVSITAMKNGGQPAEICKKCLLQIINETGKEPK